MNKPSDVRQRIVERRATLGWSQNRLSLEAGVAPAQISRYESGKSKPSAQVLARLAEAMLVPFDWLLSGHDESGFENTHDERGLSMCVELDEESANFLKELKEKWGITDDMIFKAGLLALKNIKTPNDE